MPTSKTSNGKHELDDLLGSFQVLVGKDIVPLTTESPPLSPYTPTRRLLRNTQDRDQAKMSSRILELEKQLADLTLKLELAELQPELLVEILTNEINDGSVEDVNRELKLIAQINELKSENETLMSINDGSVEDVNRGLNLVAHINELKLENKTLKSDNEQLKWEKAQLKSKNSQLWEAVGRSRQMFESVQGFKE